MLVVKESEQCCRKYREIGNLSLHIIAGLSINRKGNIVLHGELFAVVEAVKHFHAYVYRRKVVVRTDHGALKWLLTFKNPEGQMARWLGLLGNYDLDIQYRAGKSHGNADALSRRPWGECKHCSNQESKERSSEMEDSPVKICMVNAIKSKELPWMETY